MEDKKVYKPYKKKNFMNKQKFNFKKGDSFVTTFHVGISSKAMFGLSEGALKLYLLFVLNGKGNAPTVKMFANRMKKSERTISRYYDELKEGGFLKLQCIKPKLYKYTFDYNGNIDYVKPEKIELVEPSEEQVSEVETTQKVEVVEENKNQEVFEKVKTIVEYEDFAVLENIYWGLEEDEKQKVLEILESRSGNNKETDQVIKWFLDKVKYL